MPHIRLTRRYQFAAAHRLHTPLLSEEGNQEVYGKCNNPYGHGHDYTLEVSVTGEVDPGVGRLLPLEALDGFIHEVILSRFDRRNLNVEIMEFAALVPTTENLAVVMARRIAAAWPRWFAGSAARFEKVRVWETRRNIFEVMAPLKSERENNADEIVESRSSTV